MMGERERGKRQREKERERKKRVGGKDAKTHLRANLF